MTRRFEGVMPLTCYLCGRDFGRKSLGIHLPVCRKKFQIEQKSLPDNLKRVEPEPPQLLDKILAEEDISEDDIKNYNDRAVEIWNNETLVKCDHCNRSFLPEKLSKHQKCCSLEKPMQNLNKVKENASKLEEMMRKSSFQQPKQKQRKLKRSYTDNSNASASSHEANKDNGLSNDGSEEVFQCSCSCDEHHEEEIIVPKIQDFVDEIENSGVIEDVEKSRQLLLLIQLFLKVKNLNPCEDENMDDQTLKLPPLEQ